MRTDIRSEQAEDAASVRRVNEAAFGRPDEADLVERLRERVPSYLALVAVREGEVLGHIAFTPVALDPARPGLDMRGLAPMAVLPRYQRAGIGAALVREGLGACRRDGADGVVVLGHPDYYPRFGFAPAAAFGLTSEYDVPPEAFMVQALRPGVFDAVEGIVRYDAVFAL